MIKVVKSEKIEKHRDIYVIYGRDTKNRDAMYDFLRSLDLNPQEWIERIQSTNVTSSYIGDILKKTFDENKVFIVLLTPDDIACLREEFQEEKDKEYEIQPTPQARPNVIFEAGMAFALHRDSTIFVQIGDNLRPFSNISGIYVIPFDDSSEKRKELIEHLKIAGCKVNDGKTSWLKAGEFQINTEYKKTDLFEKKTEKSLNPFIILKNASIICFDTYFYNSFAFFFLFSVLITAIVILTSVFLDQEVMDFTYKLATNSDASKINIFSKSLDISLPLMLLMLFFRMLTVTFQFVPLIVFFYSIYSVARFRVFSDKLDKLMSVNKLKKGKD